MSFEKFPAVQAQLAKDAPASLLDLAAAVRERLLVEDSGEALRALPFLAATLQSRGEEPLTARIIPPVAAMAMSTARMIGAEDKGRRCVRALAALEQRIEAAA